MAGEERVIVSDIAGTTRDATDTVIENEASKFVFIDTAGIRKKSKVLENIGKIQRVFACIYMAVDRADVAVIVIDASVGFTEYDSKVAGYAHDKAKGCIVAVNKWMLLKKKLEQWRNIARSLRLAFHLCVIRSFCVYLQPKQAES